MKTHLRCFPCLMRQCVDLIERAVSCEERREEVLRTVLSEYARMDFEQPAPLLARVAFDQVVRASGEPDPLRSAKEEANRQGLELLPRLRERVEQATDPFDAAVRVAIAGNVVDLGAKRSVSREDVQESIEEAFSVPLGGAEARRFRSRVEEAERILYLTDNAGEIVFDRLLLERLPAGRVTVAVRGEPTINDAVLEDAVLAGVSPAFPVIDNGSPYAGTWLPSCSKEFRRRFAAADLIISKGQGNYETLQAVPGPIWFLFKVKCEAVAALSGRPTGAQVLLEG